MLEPAETYEYKGVSVSIHWDEYPENPYKTWDHASSLLVDSTLARRYDLGTYDLGAFSSSAHAARYLRIFEGYALAIPFEFSDYGSGQRAYLVTESRDYDTPSGFLVMTRETVEKEWKGDLAAAERCARAEFEEFSSYVEGDTFWVQVAEGTPEEESVAGYYGLEWAREAANEIASYISPIQAARLEREAHYRFEPSTLI